MTTIGGSEMGTLANGTELSVKPGEYRLFRHSREDGNPSFPCVEGMDPRLRGGDEP